MGLYDRVTLPEALTLPGYGADPSAATWQTKSFEHPFLEEYRVTRGELTAIRQTSPEESDWLPFSNLVDHDRAVSLSAGEVEHLRTLLDRLAIELDRAVTDQSAPADDTVATRAATALPAIETYLDTRHDE